MRLIVWAFKAVILLVFFSVLWVAIYAAVPVPVTATMLMDENGITKDWESLDNIDRNLVRAVIAAEDSKFCSHHGFDLEAIRKAMAHNEQSSRVRGGSTISQQTAKNVFLWPDRSYVRKGLEAYFTVLIEVMWGKRRIMEVYLNVAETGIGTYGAEAGSQRYFQHPASSMSRSEAARMAAALPLPKERAVVNPSGWLRRHGNTISSRINVVANEGLDSCVYN